MTDSMIRDMPEGYTARTLPQVLRRDEARLLSEFSNALGEDIGIPFREWARRCHEISLALVRTGQYGRCRVARGGCQGVPSQHSWIILGDDCYDPGAIVVDPTLWSYADDVNGILVTRNLERHTPHGYGEFFRAPMPSCYGGPDIELTPEIPLGEDALEFLDVLGPLDLRGWGEVAHLPVLGWPAKEILTAMTETQTKNASLGVLIPIDVRGMLLDGNPGSYYW